MTSRKFEFLVRIDRPIGPMGPIGPIGPIGLIGPIIVVTISRWRLLGQVFQVQELASHHDQVAPGQEGSHEGAFWALRVVGDQLYE